MVVNPDCNRTPTLILSLTLTSAVTIIAPSVAFLLTLNPYCYSGGVYYSIRFILLFYITTTQLYVDFLRGHVAYTYEKSVMLVYLGCRALQA